MIGPIGFGAFSCKPLGFLKPFTDKDFGALKKSVIALFGKLANGEEIFLKRWGSQDMFKRKFDCGYIATGSSTEDCVRGGLDELRGRRLMSEVTFVY